MVNLQLLDGSCKNCARLFAALEETMASNAPVAIVFTSDGSIILYMEDRFLIESTPQGKTTDSGQDLPIPTGKEKRRRFKENSEKRIRVPKSDFSIIYSGAINKKESRPQRAENQRVSHRPNTYKFSMSGRAHTYLRFLKRH